MDEQAKKPSLGGLGSVRRQTMQISREQLIETSQLHPDQPLPLVVKPIAEEINLIDWAKGNRELIEGWLLKHGGVLFRNFKPKSIAEFENLLASIAGQLLDYSYRSTPRSQVGGKIYTSTEYPADQSIPMHNEMAYTRSWPMKIGFFAVKIAEQGGETPIADSRKVYTRIEPAIRERFIERGGVKYVRNYGTGVDLPWQEVFQTDDKAQAEHYCQSAGIAFEWRGPDWLRTSQVCQAVATHPKTGDSIWFNQAHLFHVSSLPPGIRDSLLSTFPEEDLPRNTYYGDGTPIEGAVLDAIRLAYEQEMVIFPWQEGDILLLDNMLTAHGRQPYAGSRRTVVGMAEPMSADS